MSFYIRRHTGEMEEFDVQKFRRSLTRPGASADLVEQIITHVQQNINNFKTTEDLYRYALEQLKEKNPYVAARYNVKKALLEFGPTGFPFEKYIAEILKAQGYQVLLNQIVRGWCVDHEIDIIAKKDNVNFMVECKFHNELSFFSHVQVPLYTEARFHDIQRTWQKDTGTDRLTHSWIFTNTSFTYEAIKYGNCIGMQLTSWDYPKENNLADLINKYQLHPITAVPTLNHKQKAYFLNHGFVLAKDVSRHKDLLKQAGLSHKQIEQLFEECTHICKL